MDEDRFPNFPYPADEVLRFVQADELFSCLLRNGHVIHFSPNDVHLFKAWLMQHGADNLQIGGGRVFPIGLFTSRVVEKA